MKDNRKVELSTAGSSMVFHIVHWSGLIQVKEEESTGFFKSWQGGQTEIQRSQPEENPVLT